jgi:hypothetical protein
MNYKSFWAGIILFSLTFLFSSYFTKRFIEVVPQKQEAVQTQQDNNPKIVSSKPKELNKNLSDKPKCKRYANGRENLSKLIKEIKESKALLENQKSLNENEKRLYQQKILENEREIVDIMKEKSKDKKSQKRQKDLSDVSDSVHNLLLIENCVEY